MSLGRLVGRQTAEGVLELAYSQLAGDGGLVTGKCRSVPEVLADGRIRLHEHWERFGEEADQGVSIIVETSRVCPPLEEALHRDD